MELEDVEPLSTSRWPKAVQHFSKLRHFSLKRTKAPLGQPSTIRKLIQLLPSTLEYLLLWFHGVGEALLVDDARETNLDTFFHNVSESEPSDLLISSHPCPAPKVVMWNMDKFFPRLQTLILKSTPQLSSICLFTCADFVSLPRSLTNLSFMIGVQWKLNDMSQLPPGITRCAFGFGSTLLDSAIPTLPPLLTTLDTFESSYTYDLIKAVPSITSMTSHSRLDFSSPNWQWPSNLRTLFLRDIGQFHADFPPSLTQLTVHSGLMTVRLIHALPASLVALHISSVDFNHIRQHDWPRIKTLKVWGQSSAPIFAFKELPPTLEVLSIGLQSFLEFDLETYIASCAMTIDQIKSQIDTSQLPLSVLQALSQGYHLGLPLKLRALSLTCASSKRMTICPPPFLTTLNLCSTFINDFPTLTQRFTSHLKEFIITGQNAVAPIPKPDAPLAMPSFGLTLLCLYRVPFASFSSSILKEFPRSLIKLELLQPGAYLVPSDLQFLPPNLTSLLMNSDFDSTSLVRDTSFIVGGHKHPMGWEEEMSKIPLWLNYLPRTLRELLTPTLNVRSDDLANLPPNLRKLNIGKVAEMSPDLFTILPHSLRLLVANFVPTLQYLRGNSSTVDTSGLDERTLLPPYLSNFSLGASFNGLLKSRKARMNREYYDIVPEVDPRVRILLNG